MALWMEIRCEERGDGREQNRCWSDDNNGPMDMSPDDNASILATMKSLREEATKLGWKRAKNDGWVCPGCIANAAKDQA